MPVIVTLASLFLLFIVFVLVIAPAPLFVLLVSACLFAGVAVGHRTRPEEPFLAVVLVVTSVLLLGGFVLLPTGDWYFTGGLLSFLLGSVACGLVWGALARRAGRNRAPLDS